MNHYESNLREHCNIKQLYFNTDDAFDLASFLSQLKSVYTIYDMYPILESSKFSKDIYNGIDEWLSNQIEKERN